jgi:hypothetical protein
MDEQHQAQDGGSQGGIMESKKAVAGSQIDFMPL